MDKRNGENEKYGDIIGLPHREPTARHPRMTMLDRAAQFAPFAALKGYEEAVGETARFTDTRPELSDDAKEQIDRRLCMLLTAPDRRPIVEVTYFRPDERKRGGACVTVEDCVLRIDPKKRILFLRSHGQIPLDVLLELNGAFFTAEATVP